MSAKQITKIAKDLSLARAEISRLEKELARVKGNAKSTPAKKKAAKPAPAKAKPKKPPSKKAAAPKKAAPAKPNKSAKKGLVGDFNDTSYLKVILGLAKQTGSWSQIVAAVNEKGYTTKQGNTVAANNFTRDLARRLKSDNAEVKKLTEQIFAVLKK